MAENTFYFEPLRHCLVDIVFSAVPSQDCFMNTLNTMLGPVDAATIGFSLHFDDVERIGAAPSLEDIYRFVKEIVPGGEAFMLELRPIQVLADAEPDGL